MSVLTDKFPNLARYEDPQTILTVPVIDDEKSVIYLDALTKIYDQALRYYSGAFCAGVNFLKWAQVNLGTDYAEYLNLEIAIDDLWARKAPLEMFMNALRNWARAYLYLAKRCHQAVIDEINRKLITDGVEHGLG